MSSATCGWARVKARSREDPMQADMVAGGQGQPAADVAAQVAQRAAGVVQHAADLAGARQQGAAGLGQADLAADAVEQPGVELLFQCGDALADRWLGQVQAFAGGREAAGFGDGDEGVEAGQIQCSGFHQVIQSMKNLNLLHRWQAPRIDRTSPVGVGRAGRCEPHRPSTYVRTHR